MSGRWRRSLTQPAEHLRTAWPALAAPADPYSGDEIFLRKGSHSNLLEYSLKPISRVEHDRLDEEFCAIYLDILSGHQDWSAIDAVAGPLGLVVPRKHDPRPPHTAPRHIDDVVLSDIGEDQVPDMGVVSIDRVLGPFSDDATPRGVRTVAGSVMALSPLLRGGVLPVSRMVKQRPRPETAMSSSLRALARTPAMLWSSRPSLTPMLPFAPAYAPHAVSNQPNAPFFVGRVVMSPDGWWVSGALPLPHAPPVSVLMRRLTLELYRLRRHERRLTWEDLLRERAEVLYRSVCEWSWLNHHDEVLRCWSRCC